MMLASSHLHSARPGFFLEGRDDSCVGVVKLFSQSDDPTSWTDGVAAELVITFSNVTHHSGCVQTKTEANTRGEQLKFKV